LNTTPGGPIEVLEVHCEPFEKDTIEQTVEVASYRKAARRTVAAFDFAGRRHVR
jgi:hypothetical protein